MTTAVVIGEMDSGEAARQADGLYCILRAARDYLGEQGADPLLAAVALVALGAAMASNLGVQEESVHRTVREIFESRNHPMRQGLNIIAQRGMVTLIEKYGPDRAADILRALGMEVVVTDGGGQS